MVTRVKRPLVPGIIPPCLITCVCIPVETGRAPSHLLKMVFKLPSDDGRRSTLRLYSWVIFTSFYATSRVANLLPYLGYRFIHALEASPVHRRQLAVLRQGDRRAASGSPGAVPGPLRPPAHGQRGPQPEPEQHRGRLRLRGAAAERVSGPAGNRRDDLGLSPAGRRRFRWGGPAAFAGRGAALHCGGTAGGEFSSFGPY